MRFVLCKYFKEGSGSHGALSQLYFISPLSLCLFQHVHRLFINKSNTRLRFPSTSSSVSSLHSIKATSQPWFGRAPPSWAWARPPPQTALLLWWPATSQQGMSPTRDTLTAMSCQPKLPQLPPKDLHFTLTG